MGIQPGQRGWLRCHIARRVSGACALLGSDGPRDIAGSGPRLGVIPLGTCHCLTHRTSRATGACEPAKWWYESGRLPLACVQCNPGHTADVSGALVQEALGSEVRLVGGRPHASHRYQRPATGFLCDPTVLLARPLAPEDEPADQKERGSAAHPLSDGGKNIVLPKVLYEQGDFTEPGWS